MTSIRLQSWVLGVLILGALTLSFFIFRPYLAAVLLALIFVVAFMPLHRRLESVIKWPSFSAFVSTVIVLTFLLLPLFSFGALLFQEIRDISNHITQQNPDWISDAWSQAGMFFDERVPFVSMDMVVSQSEPIEIVQAGVQRTALYFENILTGAIKLFIGTFIMVLAIFYLFRDGRHLIESVKNLSPLGSSDTVSILGKMERAINAVVRGRLLVGIIQGFVIGTGLALFGIPSAILWAFVAAIASVLPIVGPMFVVVPASLFLFFNGLTFSAVGLLFWGIASVIIVDEYLGSVLIDQRMRIHPLLVLVSVLGGISFFGPIGFVLGPVVLSLLFALLEIYSKTLVKAESVAGF